MHTFAPNHLSVEDELFSPPSSLLLPFSHAEHTSTTSSLLACRFSLHLLADFYIDLEELRNTSIQTDGFSFIKIAFSVIRRYAFLRT